MLEEILFLLNNQCSISRPSAGGTYLFTVRHLDGRSVCKSMSFSSALEGAIIQVNKVREYFEVRKGNFLTAEQWDKWFDHCDFPNPTKPRVK